MCDVCVSPCVFVPMASLRLIYVTAYDVPSVGCLRLCPLCNQEVCEVLCQCLCVTLYGCNWPCVTVLCVGRLLGRLIALASLCVLLYGIVCCQDKDPGVEFPAPSPRVPVRSKRWGDWSSWLKQETPSVLGDKKEGKPRGWRQRWECRWQNWVLKDPLSQGERKAKPLGVWQEKVDNPGLWWHLGVRFSNWRLYQSMKQGRRKGKSPPLPTKCKIEETAISWDHFKNKVREDNLCRVPSTSHYFYS